MMISANTLLSTVIPTADINAIIPCENYSNLDKLIRVITLVLRFITLLLTKGTTQTHQEMFPLEMYDKAKTMWYLYVQRSLANEKNIE